METPDQCCIFPLLVVFGHLGSSFLTNIFVGFAQRAIPHVRCHFAIGLCGLKHIFAWNIVQKLILYLVNIKLWYELIHKVEGQVP